MAPTEVARYVAGADLAPVLYVPVTTNYRNALPNRFFHAIAAGVPVLYSRDLVEVTAIAESLAIGLCWDPSDPVAMARTIREIDADRAALARLRERSRAARDVLNWEQEEVVLAGIIDDALRL
jgi:glycosyltransferase involved in cell wall biosynthesis